MRTKDSRRIFFWISSDFLATPRTWLTSLYCAELAFLRFFDMVSKFTDLNWLQFFVQAFRGLIQLRGYKAAAELLKKEKTSDAVSPSNGK